MQAFIVAMEYSGAVICAGVSTRWIPVCEHAYDLETATLAGHPGGGPPIAFPGRQRGWNSQPQAARCPDCGMVVQRIVRDLIAAVFAATLRRSGS
jgi:hypothetical protein